MYLQELGTLVSLHTSKGHRRPGRVTVVCQCRRKSAPEAAPLNFADRTLIAIATVVWDMLMERANSIFHMK